MSGSTFEYLLYEYENNDELMIVFNVKEVTLSGKQIDSYI